MINSNKISSRPRIAGQNKKQYKTESIISQVNAGCMRGESSADLVLWLYYETEKTESRLYLTPKDALRVLDFFADYLGYTVFPAIK